MQVPVYSGIFKFNGEKVYHAYLLDEHKHDQTFVKIALDNILQGVDLEHKVIVTESDNCVSQYMSVKHFFGIHTLCNIFGENVIRVLGIARHAK